MVNPIKSIKEFITQHKTLCAYTLGLAIIGYSIYALGKRGVAWIIKPEAIAKKVEHTASVPLKEVALSSEPPPPSILPKNPKPILKKPNSPRKQHQVRWKENLESVRQISAIIRD